MLVADIASFILALSAHIIMQISFALYDCTSMSTPNTPFALDVKGFDRMIYGTRGIIIVLKRQKFSGLGCQMIFVIKLGIIINFSVRE